MPFLLYMTRQIYEPGIIIYSLCVVICQKTAPYKENKAATGLRRRRAHIILSSLLKYSYKN